MLPADEPDLVAYAAAAWHRQRLEGRKAMAGVVVAIEREMRELRPHLAALDPALRKELEQLDRRGQRVRRRLVEENP
jgi:hypothetical protein